MQKIGNSIPFPEPLLQELDSGCREPVIPPWPPAVTGRRVGRQEPFGFEAMQQGIESLHLHERRMGSELALKCGMDAEAVPRSLTKDSHHERVEEPPEHLTVDGGRIAHALTLQPKVYAVKISVRRTLGGLPRAVVDATGAARLRRHQRCPHQSVGAEQAGHPAGPPQIAGRPHPTRHVPSSNGIRRPAGTSTEVAQLYRQAYCRFLGRLLEERQRQGSG